MCTVTYLPTTADNLIFTSNRDEDPSRSVGYLQRMESSAGHPLILPRDQAGGSWIALSETGRLACILNGAFIKHQRKLPYRKSRGLILIDFFDWPDAFSFWSDYDLANIEPFTLISWQGGQLVEGRWDGDQAHTKVLDPLKPYIWASATLYNEQMRKQREGWWQSFLLAINKGQPENIRPAPACHPQVGREVQKFHLTTGSENPTTALRMSRPGVATVSMTQILRTNGQSSMTHHDLTTQTVDHKEWPA